MQGKACCKKPISSFTSGGPGRGVIVAELPRPRDFALAVIPSCAPAARLPPWRAKPPHGIGPSRPWPRLIERSRATRPALPRLDSARRCSAAARATEVVEAARGARPLRIDSPKHPNQAYAETSLAAALPQASVAERPVVLPP
jgi:hypothetical protein